MQAIEFEAIAQHHTLRLPSQVPDGIPLRVLVLMEDDQPAAPSDTANVKPRRRPSARLTGSVTMQDDLIAPAAPEDDWNALR